MKSKVRLFYWFVIFLFLLLCLLSMPIHYAPCVALSTALVFFSANGIRLSLENNETYQKIGGTLFCIALIFCVLQVNKIMNLSMLNDYNDNFMIKLIVVTFLVSFFTYKKKY